MIFTSCVPSFIEGVFHDLCLVFGYDNNELLSEGFQKKVDKLKENLGHHLCYEYYIFYFRLLRNRVAHGQVKGSEIAGLANILLLDMEHITSLVNLETIPYNYKLFVLNELEKNINTPNYKYLMKFVLMDKVVIPDYYNVTKERNEAIYDLLKTQEFWGFIDHELEYDSPTVKHGIHFVLQKINKLIPNYQECKSRLSQLGIKSTDKKLADHYLKYLTRDRITI